MHEITLSLIEVVNQAFFKHQPLLNCGLFRIAIGLVNLYNVYRYFWPNRALFFGEDGLYPMEEFEKSDMCYGRLSLWNKHIKMDWNHSHIVLMCMISFLCLTVGFLTPLAAFMSYLTFSSLLNRCPYMISSAEALNRQILFWCIFLGSGSVLSVDCWLAGNNQFDATGSPIAMRVIQLTILMVYFKTVISKVVFDEWWDGRAILHAVQLNDTKRFGLPWKMIDSQWKCRIMSRGVLLSEAMLVPGLAFMPQAFIPLGIILHLSIGIIFDLTFFSSVMLCSYLLFLPL